MSFRRALLAMVAIPLTSNTGWQDLKFKKIPSNANTFTEKGLSIQVDKSSSPLIFPLKQATQVLGFRATLKIEGSMTTSKGFPEDAYLRLGLVAPGPRKLNAMERWMATDWLKKLFSLAPKDGGVDKVYFFNLADHGLGETRVFPGSKDLMVETVARVRAKDELNIEFAYTLPKPIETIALWLSVDGDNTKSKFEVKMDSLQIETKLQDPEKSE